MLACAARPSDYKLSARLEQFQSRPQGPRLRYDSKSACPLPHRNLSFVTSLTRARSAFTLVPMAQKEFDSVALLLHETDNVAVLKHSVLAGDELLNQSFQIRAATSIQAGHKIALAEISDGAPVKKYGQIIGFAQGHIAPGDHVHAHNLQIRQLGHDYQFCVEATPVSYYPPE